MSQTLLEKLQLKNEKSLLIQGLPSSIEKQFAKLAFAKNVTPLLKSRKIDFALVFAVNESQLSAIVHEVVPALHADGKLWVAYPKPASKIATTLNRDCSWTCITQCGFEGVKEVPLDHVWTATRFTKMDRAPIVARRSPSVRIEVPHALNGSNFHKNLVSPPDDFVKELKRSKVAFHFFDKLSSSNKNDYVAWVYNAKREETRSKRLEAAIVKLAAGKRNPTEV
ncbi:MAG TPA: YdeI/OmpD-associated family protein [Puia sp.]|nr:YdeI/OmpD-associated family protein [Puia sp.]